MSDRNRQRDAYVDIVKTACGFLKRELPEEIIVVHASGSEVYQVCCTEFSSKPEELKKALWAYASSKEDASALVAFLPSCEFVVLDMPDIHSNMYVRRCSLVDPMTLDDRQVAGRTIVFQYIPN